VAGILAAQKLARYEGTGVPATVSAIGIFEQRAAAHEEELQVRVKKGEKLHPVAIGAPHKKDPAA
jgi:hypothetical protein